MNRCNHSIVFNAPNANEKTFLPTTHTLPRSNGSGGHLGSVFLYNIGVHAHHMKQPAAAPRRLS